MALPADVGQEDAITNLKNSVLRVHLKRKAVSPSSRIAIEENSLPLIPLFF